MTVLRFPWPQLFKRWIALSTGYITIQRIAQLVSLILIRWIVIYPVDSAIQRLNNWGLVYLNESHLFWYGKKNLLFPHMLGVNNVNDR